MKKEFGDQVSSSAQEAIKSRAAEGLDTLRSLERIADAGNSLNLDALNNIILLGGSLARKECYRNTEPTTAQSEQIKSTVGEIETLLRETLMNVPVGKDIHEIALKDELKERLANLVELGDLIIERTPASMRNSQSSFIAGTRLNAAYALNELHGVNVDSFKSLGDINLITSRAETLLEDSSYPKTGGDNVPTNAEKDQIKMSIKDLLSLAEEAREKVNQQIIGNSDIQEKIKEKLKRLILLGSEIMKGAEEAGTEAMAEHA